MGDLVYNLTDASVMTVTGVTTTTNENDTLTGELSGGTDDDWDTGDLYHVDGHHNLDVGQLVRVKARDPAYIDADYLVVGIDYEEPSFDCVIRVAKNFSAPVLGDQQTYEEILQAIQNDGRMALQRSSY